MHCVKCGKEIKDGSSFCSECGAAQLNDDLPERSNSHTQKGLNTPYNTLCIIGVVVSGISLLVPLIGIAGFILSVIGFRKVKNTGERGRELAIAGIVVGIIMTIYCVANLLLSFFVLGHLSNSLGDFLDVYSSALADL